jgi:PEP-CTERM motif
MRRIFVTLLAGFLLLAGIQAMATVVVGLPPDAGTGNCFPFGCAYSGEYQQVYTSSLFSGPITITDLEFFNTVFDAGATAMNSGNWMISLSTTSADWNTLSSTFANNIGPNNTLVFNGNLAQAWAFGDTLTINLSTPFTYDPSMGNLLMDVMVSNSSDAGGVIYFDTNGYNNGGLNGNTFFGRVYNGGTVNSGYGLVTGFSTGTTTPEPGTLVLLGSGLLGVAGVIRRKLMI